VYGMDEFEALSLVLEIGDVEWLGTHQTLKRFSP